MANLGQKAEAAYESTRRLTQQIERIDQVLNSIGQFTRETHVLALNAEVQAARAGEMGQGFGVVAVEIGKLSEQSRDLLGRVSDSMADVRSAAKSTIEVAEASQRTAEESLSHVHRIAAAFAELADASRTAAQVGQQIAENAQQQAAAILRLETLLERDTAPTSPAEENLT
jgi:methyl-accepting chemotaxis protein